jgi:tripartite-type tricarboxylate transporter receptor subunit TctC
LLAAQVSATNSPIGDYLPCLKSGQLSLLGNFGAARSRLAPDVPTPQSAPEVIESLVQLGPEAGADTFAEQLKAVKDDNAAWGPIVRAVGFTSED